MPLDTSSTELFSAWEQILTLLISAHFSLTPGILLLRDLGRGSLWLLDRFWCTLHVTWSSPLQRDNLGCE